MAIFNSYVKLPEGRYLQVSSVPEILMDMGIGHHQQGFGGGYEPWDSALK